MISLSKIIPKHIRYAIIAMSILYFIFLKMLFVSYVRSDVLPGVVCVCLGANSNIQLFNKVNISDIPERCKVVIIGEDYFCDEVSVHDAAVIKALKEADKTVYMIYMCPLTREWNQRVSDSTELDTFIEPMLKFLNEKNIDGVILAHLKTHSGQIPDYAYKINSFISKIRQRVPSIKIGLHLNGNDSHHFTENQRFDFTQTNTTVDFYVVDLWSIGPICKPNVNILGGRQPIHSDDPNVLSLEQMSEHITNSSLEKSKLVVYVYDLPTLTHKTESYVNFTPTYSDYCKRTGNEGLWYADTSQILYEKVKFLKNNNFQGLMIQYLDLDDMTNACECGQFPVANTFFDAWEGKPLNICPALS